MTSYLFIDELFKNVLTKSTVIQGRYQSCPKWGQEVNTDEFENVIKDVVKKFSGKEFPCALLMPPSSNIDKLKEDGCWENYTLVMLFLTTTFYTSTNQVKSPNRNTNTSTHTVQEDWHDMKRCAKDFLVMLNKVVDSKPVEEIRFRIDTNTKTTFDPVSFNGNDRLSGVKLGFGVSVWTGCDLEDYNAADVSNIVIPNLNIHATHLH